MALTTTEREFLRDFFRSVNFLPLEPTDPKYVHIYSDPELTSDQDNDPVLLLGRAIEWTPGESVQLFSGFRGTGKSTELRRLRKLLKDQGYLVVLCDMEDYLNLSTPVDITDFLMAVAGAFGEILVEEGLLDNSPANESYWTRFTNFLTRTKVDLAEISGKIPAGAAEIDIKANLKSDPSFRQRLQQRMAGFLGLLVKDVRSFIEDCVKALKQKHGNDKEVVLLLDSVEHIRGTSINADEVQASVETLFATHADNLRFPNLHVVYTVPPYLKVRYPNLGALYEPGGVQVLPAIKVTDRGDHSAVNRGLTMLERVLKGRGDWVRLLGTRPRLDRVSLSSGGHLRDFLRIMAEIIRRADQLPVSDAALDNAINQIRIEFLPIADNDAQWLARIAEAHEAALENKGRLADFARFLDTHVVLVYRNGGEWFDVHPLIRDVVIEQARRANESAGSRVQPQA
jgi:hypothetical protein